MSRQISRNTKEQDSYERAMRFLRSNKPETRLDIHLSYGLFQALERQRKSIYRNAQYPRVEYSAIDSRVTIHTIPTALHSSAAASLCECIRDCVRDVLVQHGRQNLLRLLVPVGDATYESNEGNGRGSTKSPDGGFRSRCQHSELVFVVEVGVSEGYRSLRADISLWLNEFHCRTAILLWCKENRRFGRPANPDVYSDSDQPAFEEALDQASLANPFGPYLYRDHPWFGTIDSAIIEVYRRNPTGKNAHGQLIVSTERLDLSLTLGDLYPPSEEGVEDIWEKPDTSRCRVSRFRPGGRCKGDGAKPI
ncbi:hypothetical protein V1525DRAFT_379929 [Lipomyces kononenkoae]|uniref:Uncharacterized protein n=1 Tax=Lipomyces kononenkoae TaxID=34357 RepID=A0ACC3SWY2_LIPKO